MDKTRRSLKEEVLMDRETVIVMNWIFLPLLVAATIFLIWKMVGEKLMGKAFSSGLITSYLVLGLAVIGMIQLNIERSLNWLHWVLLVVESLMLVFLWKRLWSPLMQKLRG